MNRILVCRTCQQETEAVAEGALAALRNALLDAALIGAFDVGTVDCMGACEQPVSLAFQGEGRATLVFAGLSFPQDIDDIVATGRAWLAAENGWIEDARPCGRLRLCLRARIPALGAG
ncbi:DUF1636 family protein [Roseibium sp. AS2]|uniref:DUF1636 family protein n=1 Tax=Roseibium sp. AS2 TaxID=3135781 RepID=UPI00316E741A